MQNKQLLLNLVNRAEWGVITAEEAQILRDAVELLDDMAMTLDMLSNGAARYSGLHGYEPSSTQTFRAIRDDHAPGRP